MSTAEFETMLKAAARPAPERLRERVRTLESAPRRVTALPAFPLRRVAVGAVALGLSAFLAAAVVHGVASDDGDGVVVSQPASVPRQQGPALGQVPSTEDATAGRQALAPPNVTGGGRLTRAVASLTLRVDGADDLAQATSSATRVARSLGGYAASVEYVTPAKRPARAFLELRVPTARVQDALERLGRFGTIVSQRLSTRDLERQLERQTAQVRELRREIQLLVTALRDPALTPVERVRLQVRLGEARRALAQRTHARKTTISEGMLARISLVLTTEQKTGVAPPHHQGRLGRMLGDAASFLALEATILLFAAIVASPLVLLGLAAWGGNRLRRRREEQRLLAVP
jgi:Domain of unknown function (DUF4349)